MARNKTDGRGNYVGDAVELDVAIGSLPFIAGVWYFVDPLVGSNSNDGLVPGAPLADLEAAYDKCVSGQGDGIVVISRGTASADTTSYLSQPLTWSKHGITVFGVAARNGYFGRARISNVEHTTGELEVLSFTQGSAGVYDTISRTTGSFIADGFVPGDVIRVTTEGTSASATGLIVKSVAALAMELTTIGTLATEAAAQALTSVVNSYCAPLMVITGSNNSFYNLHFTNVSTDEAALGAVAVGANRNYFNNCHFIGAASTVPGAVTSCYDLKLYSSECVFDDCYFGTNSTVWAAANGHIMLGNSTTPIGQNFFNRCRIISDSATAGHGAINVIDKATLGGWVHFNDCTFVNWQSGGITTLTAAIIGATPDNCGIMLHNCGMTGWLAWGANNDKWVTTNAAGAAGVGGIGGVIA